MLKLSQLRQEVQSTGVKGGVFVLQVLLSHPPRNRRFYHFKVEVMLFD